MSRKPGSVWQGLDFLWRDKGTARTVCELLTMRLELCWLSGYWRDQQSGTCAEPIDRQGTELA